MTEAEYNEIIARQARWKNALKPVFPEPAIVTLTPKGDRKPQGKLGGQKQTKCEMEYGRMLAYEFPDAVIIPWGITLRMQNGHKYTPDYLVMDTDLYWLIEVKQRGKNGFRQNSYQRARLAFDQCRAEFKLFRFRWAEKHCGTWDAKDFK